MRFFLTMPFLLFFLSCSKSPSSSSEDKSKSTHKNKINFQSPMHFSYDSKLKETEIIAIFSGESISKQQIDHNNPSLKSLNRRKQEQILLTIYDKVLTLNSDKKIIQLPFEEPQKGIQVFLKNMHVKEDSSIQFQFSKKSLNSGTVKINEKVYTVEKLSASSLPLAKILKSIFILKMRKIEEIVSRRILLKEAERQKVNFDKYVKDNISKKTEVSEQDVKNYALKNNIPEDSLNKDLLIRLKNIIGSKRNKKIFIEHSALILGKNSIQVGLKHPNIGMAALTYPEFTPQKGSGDTNITLLSNFLCKKCKKLEKFITTTVDNNINNFQLSYLFNFKKGDRRMRMLAEASMCIAKQGNKNFWDFQKTTLDKSFDGQEQKINEVVKTMGLDYVAYRKCFLAREFKKTIDDQLAAVKSLGHINLPAVLINGQVFENPSSMDDIETAMNDLLTSGNAQAKKSWWQWLKSLFS